MSSTILTLNGGSSSLKFALFDAQPSPVRIGSGRIERIGSGARVKTDFDGGESAVTNSIEAPDLGAAARQILDLVDQRVGLGAVAAVGHRIVHGGTKYTATCRIDAAVVENLREIAPLDPEHLPGEIAVIEACADRLKQTPQMACFDTAFHRDLPRVAQLLAIPLKYNRAGIRRYGFHGLSYSYLLEELARAAGPEAAAGRVVLAHLGNGASMAAVRDGRCVDTTMSFTPTAGLVMGTRSGDLDPGVMIHLARSEQASPDALDKLVNQQSGLLGLSETSGDVRDLLARRQDDQRAADAIAVFCYQARKWVAAMAAALGGIDTLVFSGGIGENSPVIRSEICSDLRFLGIELAPQLNDRGGGRISAENSACDVRVIHTDEETMIAREVQRLLAIGK